ncbi:hypothetical protein N7461_004665 [Penicillium sp. DV-2018c]|nr:hypothetical protein N7461_004665 [Penicillium sp. DV-2018c]
MMKNRRFPNLPAELRLKIWELATPARIIEVAEPSDPEIEPAEDLKKAWLLNRKVPPTAHVCFDSRTTLRQSPMSETVVWTRVGSTRGGCG